ncbi:MAG: LacI family DNA-binding transcriptional regulator [Actinomycetota bacterium]
MQDVATAAGVSAMTVSRALRDPSTVSDATLAAVQRAIEETGYQRNAVASALASGRTHSIGIITWIDTEYVPNALLEEFDRAVRRAGYSARIESMESRTEAAVLDAYHRLRAQGVDGIVTPRCAELGRSGVVDVPTIVQDTHLGRSGPTRVVLDWAAAGRLATDHLLDLGHETVHHVAGPTGVRAWSDRTAGWESALTARGREVPPFERGDATHESGARAARALLAGDPGLTAVFAANDQMAIGVGHAVREAGRRCPEDVSIIGIDNIPGLAFHAVPLSTISFDLRSYAERTIARLVALIEDDEGPSGFVVAPTLVTRASTAPPGG